MFCSHNHAICKSNIFMSMAYGYVCKVHSAFFAHSGQGGNDLDTTSGDILRGKILKVESVSTGKVCRSMQKLVTVNLEKQYTNEGGCTAKAREYENRGMFNPRVENRCRLETKYRGQESRAKVEGGIVQDSRVRFPGGLD